MDLSFITRVTSPQNGTGTLQGGSTGHQTEVLRAADLLMGRNTAGKEIQRGQGRRKRSRKSLRALLVRVLAGHEELPVFCPSPGPVESHGKSCTYGAGEKHTGITAADKCTGLFPTSPTILHQGQEKSFAFKPKAGARQQHTHHRWYKLLTPAAGGRTQGGQSPETGTLGVGLAQSVVDLRYQNRARKSSLHVMKPGLVGECTIQRTMLLWPRESRFLRSAVLESQQQRLMVLSSGSKI